MVGLSPSDSRAPSAGQAVVLVWSELAVDYLPAALKASANPKEFRGPVDPSLVAGVVLNLRDTWDATV